MPLLSELPAFAKKKLSERGFALDRDINELQNDVHPLVWAVLNDYQNQSSENQEDENQEDLVQALLNAHADPRIPACVGPGEKASCLTACIRNALPGTLDLLFAHSNTRNLMDPNVCDGTFSGMTPLTFAIRKLAHYTGHELEDGFTVVKILLSHPNIDIHKRESNTGMSPLDICCSMAGDFDDSGKVDEAFLGDSELSKTLNIIIRLLLERGAKINDNPNFNDQMGVPPILGLFYQGQNKSPVMTARCTLGMERALEICFGNSHAQVDLSVHKDSSVNYAPGGWNALSTPDLRQFKTPLMLAIQRKSKKAEELILDHIRAQAYEYRSLLLRQHKDSKEIDELLENFVKAHAFMPSNMPETQSSKHSELYLESRKKLQTILKEILVNSETNFVRFAVPPVREHIYNMLQSFYWNHADRTADLQAKFEKIYRNMMVQAINTQSVTILVLLFNITQNFPHYFFVKNGGKLTEVLGCKLFQHTPGFDNILIPAFSNNRLCLNLILKRFRLAMIEDCYERRKQICASDLANRTSLQGSAAVATREFERLSRLALPEPSSGLEGKSKKEFEEQFKRKVEQENNLNTLTAEVVKPLTFSYAKVVSQMQVFKQSTVKSTAFNRVPLPLRKLIFSFVSGNDITECYDQETRASFQKLKELAWEGSMLVSQSRNAGRNAQNSLSVETNDSANKRPKP